jgi:transporter family-2 protein
VTPAQRRILACAAAALGGASVATQSEVNGDLGADLNDGFAAALISFGGGLLIIGVFVFATARGRRGIDRFFTELRAGRVRWWECLGGVCGAVTVSIQGFTVGVLGVGLFTVATVAGQSTGSLLVDHYGLGPAGPVRLSPRRMIGTGIAIVAVVIAVADRIHAPTAIELAILPAIAGFGSSYQQAVNGRVRQTTDSVQAATTVNFLLGTVAVGIALAIEILFRGAPSGHLPSQFWLYLGGPLGVVFIAVAAAVVRYTGVLILGLSIVCGNLLAALAIELLVPGKTGQPTIFMLVGIALTFVAVAVAASHSRHNDAGRAPVSVRAECPRPDEGASS